MHRKVRIPLPDGQQVDAVELEFKTVREEWNDYELADGGRVRVKTSVMKVFRILDAEGKPGFTPDGDPWVIVRHKSDISASV